jgi:hypothetical protein
MTRLVGTKDARGGAPFSSPVLASFARRALVVVYCELWLILATASLAMLSLVRRVLEFTVKERESSKKEPGNISVMMMCNDDDDVSHDVMLCELLPFAQFGRGYETICLLLLLPPPGRLSHEIR